MQPAGWGHSLGWVRYFGLSLQEIALAGKALCTLDDISAHYVSEARYRCADGEYRPIIVRTNPLRDKRGQSVKWHGMNAPAGLTRSIVGPFKLHL
jgi:PAS fold